jgi:hypothetical protein
MDVDFDAGFGEHLHRTLLFSVSTTTVPNLTLRKKQMCPFRQVGTNVPPLRHLKSSVVVLPSEPSTLSEYNTDIDNARGKRRAIENSNGDAVIGMCPSR